MFSWCRGNFQMSSAFLCFTKMTHKSTEIVLAEQTSSSASAWHCLWQWTPTESWHFKNLLILKSGWGWQTGWDMKGTGKTLNLKGPLRGHPVHHPAPVIHRQGNCHSNPSQWLSVSGSPVLSHRTKPQVCISSLQCLILCNSCVGPVYCRWLQELWSAMQ